VRHVKGILFVDYVRMLRGFKGVDWASQLPPEDVAYLNARIDNDAWYPMATFERLGNQILHAVANNDLQAVRMWGRFSVDILRSKYPLLLAEGDPIETINRFRVLRASFFDFDALEILMLHDDEAEILIRYYMGMPAEEAAAMQTLGFFERLVELAGGRNVEAKLREKSWLRDSRTLVELRWQI
jgi:hypothetical protein